LRFKEGEHIWIRVYNDREDKNTTVHFHGLSQYLSPYADGTPHTSQVSGRTRVGKRRLRQSG
jgi:FtsP/CotA-like multicopper oxidase with cupredoxin domain